MLGSGVTGVWTGDRRDVVNYVDVVVDGLWSFLNLDLVRIVQYLGSDLPREKRSFLSNSCLWVLLLLMEFRSITYRYRAGTMISTTGGSWVSVVGFVSFWIINAWHALLPSWKSVWIGTQVTFSCVRLRSVLRRVVGHRWVWAVSYKAAICIFPSGRIWCRRLDLNHLILVDDQV